MRHLRIKPLSPLFYSKILDTSATLALVGGSIVLVASLLSSVMGTVKSELPQDSVATSDSLRADHRYDAGGLNGLTWEPGTETVRPPTTSPDPTANSDQHQPEPKKKTPPPQPNGKLPPVSGGNKKPEVPETPEPDGSEIQAFIKAAAALLPLQDTPLENLGNQAAELAKPLDGLLKGIK